ncbi:hypothetical protein [Legionella clemsonensis]|uniref:Glycosyl transferase family 2 n=1 Tax=Legionella clemsonensis TaxID=1867846 RepID=A0A222P5F7_9GAMM|nr:hypothetical protein [Legionella clemsonensis]ASQ47047.1 hypothetical protein clem_12560 [Legionella clemsonensis]
MITAKIASIPERVHQLELTIKLFLEQVDKIEVYLNNYDNVPVFLRHKNIQIFTSQEFGERGDIGKFYQVERAFGYIFTLDDDLIYPADYVSTLVDKIDTYKRKALICAHANILPKRKISSYYKDKQGIHFAKKLVKDTLADIPGTGTLAFHTDNIKLNHTIFLTPNMSDIWLAIYAKQNNIPVISVSRPDLWIKQAIGNAFEKSIYAFYHRNDAYQTNIVNKELIQLQDALNENDAMDIIYD